MFVAKLILVKKSISCSIFDLSPILFVIKYLYENWFESRNPFMFYLLPPPFFSSIMFLFIFQLYCYLHKMFVKWFFFFLSLIFYYHRQKKPWFLIAMFYLRNNSILVNTQNITLIKLVQYKIPTPETWHKNSV